LTKDPFEITRTGAFSGGEIGQNSGLTITQRGVVFSIAPDPVLKVLKSSSHATSVSMSSGGQNPVNSNTTSVTISSKNSFDATTGSFLEEGSTNDGSGAGRYSSILKNLKPGTFYYVRAYAVADKGKVYYGNQVSFWTADACFIATAAYGSIVHPYVRILRDFRDQYLLTNDPGRSFVRLYYQYSPPMADCIANHVVLRQVIRLLLLPLIAVSWLILNLGMAGLLVLAVVSALSYWMLQLHWKRA